MNFLLSNPQIFAPLFSDARIATIFSDEHFVRSMVDVEAALARAQSRLNVIPQNAADQINASLATFKVDFAQLSASIEKAGVPVKNLVQQLRIHVGGEASSYVHWGATTQDIMDTAMILQSRAAIASLESDLFTFIKNLATMAKQHRSTLLAGRTHAQQALPMTFGLKVAGWLAPFLRHCQRLDEMKPRLLVVQFGGAAGTLAALGDAGPAVQAALAQELDLGVPVMPWHTQRDSIAELAGWLSMISGSLAKMAQDIILMAQTEVAELRESADFSRGGSSTMPQKNNPVVSEIIVAAARINASLLSAIQQAIIQEHERATHGWQMEWLSLPQMFTMTAVALNKALFLSENLIVDAARMQENIDNANGLILAEAISYALTEFMDRPAANKLVGDACQIVLAENRHLVDVVRELVDVPIDWVSLRDEENYLGATHVFIERVVNNTL